MYFFSDTTMNKLILLAAFTVGLVTAQYSQYDDPFGDIFVTEEYYRPPVVNRYKRPQRVPCHLHGKDRLGGHPVPHRVKCKKGHTQAKPFCGKCQHEGTEVSEESPTTTPCPQEVVIADAEHTDAGKPIATDIRGGKPIVDFNGGNPIAEVNPGRPVADLNRGEPVPRSEESATSTTKSAYMMTGTAAALTFMIGFL